jgi:hypothetical protein
MIYEIRDKQIYMNPEEKRGSAEDEAIEKMFHVEHR